MTKFATGAAGALTLALAFGGPAQAQDQVDQLLLPTPAPPAVVNDGEAYHRADDSEQDPAEVRTTQALNDEIVSRNTLAENQERVERAAFEDERARHEQAMAVSLQARLDYEEGLRQSEAARLQWEADRARWEADVRACQAGDRRRCAPARD